MSIDEPIVLVQWGDPQVEDEEIGEIKLLLEATLFGGDLQQQKSKAPQIATLIIDKSSVDCLKQEFTAFMKTRKNVQTLYFSAHGNTTGLCFNQSGNPTIPYSDLGELLTDSLCSENCIHLVFGSCEAMNPSVNVEKYMPKTIYAVSGFSGCPKSTDVAGLLASIVQDDVSLSEKLISENKNVYATGKTKMQDVYKVIEKWKKILEQHQEDPTREVLNIAGISIVKKIRDEITGKWKRRTIFLN